MSVAHEAQIAVQLLAEIGVCAFVDNDSGPLAGRKATDIRETLDICQQKYSVAKIRNRSVIPAQ